MGRSNHEYKEYRGYRWSNYIELSKQLHVSSGAVSAYLQNNKDKTVYDYIDTFIDKQEYRGFNWQTNVELSIQLGKAEEYVSAFLYKHKGSTVYDCIDYVLDSKEARNYRQHKYKGFTWKNNKELSRQLGKHESYVSNYLRKNKGQSVYDCIDYNLKKII